MIFQLSEQEQEVARAASEFSSSEIRPIADELDEKALFPSTLFKKAWELGFINSQIPEKYGGNGLSMMESVLISQAMGSGCLGVNTSFMANDLALLPIVLSDNEKLKEQWLPKFTKDPLIASFCLTEPDSGSDAASINTQLIEENGEYFLSGSKMWITNAGYADIFIVYATIDKKLKHKGICAVLVEATQEGVEIGKPEKKMGHCCSDTRGIKFQKTPIKKSQIIAEAGHGWSLAMKTLDFSRPLVAASALGGAEHAFELSKKHAAERYQFGKPLCKHQLIQKNSSRYGHQGRGRKTTCLSGRLVHRSRQTKFSKGLNGKGLCRRYLYGNSNASSSDLWWLWL